MSFFFLIHAPPSSTLLHPYQIELVTLQPVCPASPFFLAFLYTNQAVSFPAHCGLQEHRDAVLLCAISMLSSSRFQKHTGRVLVLCKGVAKSSKPSSQEVFIHCCCFSPSHILLSKPGFKQQGVITTHTQTFLRHSNLYNNHTVHLVYK